MNIDKELRDQEAFDQAPFSEEDKKLYALLMNELDKESDLVIKPSFSAEIIKKLEAKKRKEEAWEFVLFSAAIVGVLLLTMLAFAFVMNSSTESIDLLQNSPVGPAIVLTILIVIFQVIDKKYLRNTSIRKRLRQT